jgi:4,5-DOPA dioxygenase extradiol
MASKGGPGDVGVDFTDQSTAGSPRAVTVEGVPMTESRMPAAFIGHGSPMNALERNRYTDAWRAFGQAVPKPRAILVISAHWYTNATAVTGMLQPRTIHDFYGFPQELFDLQYPAPGLPEMCEQVADVVKPRWVGCDVDSWGIDHGTWSVLTHAFPDASIPVVQLSLNAFKDFDHHLELGRKLAPLRDDGVLIIGSGNIVHNLRAIDMAQPDSSYDWAQRFDDRALPTPDHYLPLLYVAGLADDQPLDLLVDGHVAGSISMAAYTLGMAEPVNCGDSTTPTTALPDIPMTESNV